MKPLKATTPVARWVLRLTLLIFLYFNYFEVVKGMNYNSINFYFASVYLLAALLLIFGAMFSKPALTVIPAIIIFLLSVYLIVKNTTGIPGPPVLKYLIPASISFLFLSTGNDS